MNDLSGELLPFNQNQLEKFSIRISEMFLKKLKREPTAVPVITRSTN